MVELSRPRPSDRVLNLMCGSGTLLVERLAREPAASVLGCDLDLATLGGARANLAAAGLAGTAALARMDATRLGLGDARFDVLLADLPYGHRMGSHEANAALYPAVLQEAARVAAGARRSSPSPTSSGCSSGPWSRPGAGGGPNEPCRCSRRATIP